MWKEHAGMGRLLTESTTKMPFRCWLLAFTSPPVPSRLASDSWTCPCSASYTASMSPSRSTREPARQRPAQTALTLWRTASSTRRTSISRSRTPSRMAGSEASQGTWCCPSPHSPVVTGSWSPSKGCRRQATVSTGFSSAGGPQDCGTHAASLICRPGDVPGRGGCGLFGGPLFAEWSGGAQPSPHALVLRHCGQGFILRE